MLDTSLFSQLGQYIMLLLVVLSSGLAGLGLVNLFRRQPLLPKTGGHLLQAVAGLYLLGFLLIGWLHLQINQHIALELPQNLAGWLNQQLAAMNGKASYAMPLYDAANPPRYMIPVWIENEKYFFWFLCYALMALFGHYKLPKQRYRATLHLFMGLQTAILFFFADPFAAPLAKFFTEIGPWFSPALPGMARIGLFMKLYPKMIFYYNASYMWLHPPLLFISYACITMTFISSVFMLFKRDPALEKLGYSYAKLGFFMLTLGMLLGYPWALQAWGPNWWWDPKICSSIMMWAVYSTYLHTRLYANKPAMWYFSSILGILCFAAMIFTFLASFYFPGEHTFQ